MMSPRLKQAIKDLKNGQTEQARRLIISEVKHDPKNITAWIWALEVAANDQEKRTILKRILAIDPDHQGARRYLKKLDQEPERPLPEHPQPTASQTETGQRDQDRDGKPSRFRGLLQLVFDWIANLPTGCSIFAIFLLILGSIFVYFRLNTSFFGLAGTNFNDLEISNSYQTITSDEMFWEVQFEGTGNSKYIGTVRYVGPIRIKEFPILTHDILVTTADFANPDLVETNVVDHKFFWKSENTQTPSGSINLIHALPADQEVYKTLLEIQKWDTVKITGREIYSIKSYQKDNTFLGTWQDMGCNTLLVETVTVIKNDEENQ